MKRINCTLDKSKVFIEIVALISTIVGAFFVGYQYYMSQKWEKSKFALSHLEKRNNIEELVLAEKMLEWWSLDNIKAPKILGAKDINYTREKLLNTLEKDYKFSISSNKHKLEPYTNEEEVYLFVFDKYFDYIEATNHYIERDLFRIEDVEIICENILSIRFYNKRKMKNKVFFSDYSNTFSNYILESNYSDVNNFINKCKALE